MIRTGVVVGVNPHAEVQLDALIGCGSCSAAGGCGIQLLPAGSKPVRVECPIPPNSHFEIGQAVQVSIPEPSQGWLKLVMRAYGWPTLGMLGGAMSGFWIATLLGVPHRQELFSVTGFIIGLSGGLLAWDKMNKSSELAHSQPLTGELKLPESRIDSSRIDGSCTGDSVTDDSVTDSCSHILKQENNK